MAEGIENIGKKDVMWSYASTIFSVGAGVIILPFILHKLPSETVGIWGIFQTITLLVSLLDFGFKPSFARNISYIFSGVKKLQKEGIDTGKTGTEVDYSLLKGTLLAMKKFYRWIAIGVFLLLSTFGTLYIFYLVNSKYEGNHAEVLIAWIILIIINCYNLYTLYYEALLTGKGYIKRTQQIVIVGQALYICVAIGLIYAGWGLIAIVSAQILSVVLRRILAYKVFFTKDMRSALDSVEGQPTKEILNAIFPNAIKVGLTQLGGFLVNKSALLIGAAYLPLSVSASYSTTMQVLDILARCATVYYLAYIPKLAQYRAENNLHQLKIVYRNNCLLLFATYLVGGIAFVLLGNWALELIRSNTMFLPPAILSVAIFISFLEHNHSTAAGFIMADNKIPFFIPSLVSGAATVILLYIFLEFTNLGVWGMILAQGIAQLAYQNWKWPSVVIKELKDA